MSKFHELFCYISNLVQNDGKNAAYARWHNVGKDLMVLDFGNTNHGADVAAFDLVGYNFSFITNLLI